MTRPCRYGPECHYLEQGRCFFYHPPSHYQTNRPSRTRNSYHNYYDSDDDYGYEPSPPRVTHNIFSNTTTNYRSWRDGPSRNLSNYLRKKEESLSDNLLLLLLMMKKKSLQDKLAEKKVEEEKVEPELIIQGKKIKKVQITTKIEDPTKARRFKDCDHFHYYKGCPHDECAICLDDFEERTTGRTITRLHCKHAFHTDCLESWLDKKSTCPLCKRDFKKAESEGNISLRGTSRIWLN